MAEWLRERFAVIDGGSDLGDVAMLNRRVAEFQRAHGLQPDAVAGPVTLMALNRASRIDEPALLVER
jgi:general secretion pathway protein A